MNWDLLLSRQHAFTAFQHFLIWIKHWLPFFQQQGVKIHPEQCKITPSSEPDLTSVGWHFVSVHKSLIGVQNSINITKWFNWLKELLDIPKNTFVNFPLHCDPSRWGEEWEGRWSTTGLIKDLEYKEKLIKFNLVRDKIHEVSRTSCQWLTQEVINLSHQDWLPLGYCCLKEFCPLQYTDTSVRRRGILGDLYFPEKENKITSVRVQSHWLCQGFPHFWMLARSLKFTVILSNLFKVWHDRYRPW